MDDKSLEILEFPRVREILAGYTSFSASRELAIDLQPLSNPEQISLLLKQSAEARHLISLEPDFSIGGVFDIREAAKTAARGKVLEPQTLVNIQKTLAAAHRLRTRLGKLSNEFPLLWNIANRIVELPHLEKEIIRCLTAGGELLDSASAKLASLRRQLKETRQQLLESLEGIIKSRRNQKFLQEHLITERDGRYVIPVKAEYRKDIKGIVHDISNTGATVFIEPWTTVEPGNELRQLAIEEKREVERILAALSAEVGANETAISRNLALIAELDLALAKARYAEKAKATEPMITTTDGNKRDNDSAGAGVLRLVEARHPLLKGKAVPLSVELGNDFSILIITGPNTGGKTVALKTIGLLTLMSQAGMPIPASEESSIPIFDNVFADIGDEQSIEQTLSTFGWHMGNIIRIIQNSSERSLVLLDELGTSTDPSEGAALARSILLHFLSRGTIAVATTHYSDLKAFAHTTPGLQNASLDFDPATLAPTYHLTVGIPGGSNALATASRLGLSAEIIAAAREMLTEGTQEIETLLADLMSEKQKIESLRNDLQKEKSEAESLSGHLEHELQRLKGQEQSILRETRDRLIREAAELQKQLRDAASELKKIKSKESIEQAKKALAVMHEQLKGQTWQTKTSRDDLSGDAADAGDIAVGDRIQLIEANVQGIVLSSADKDGQLEVQVGRTRVRLSIDSIEKIKPSAEKVSPEFTMVKEHTRGRKRSLELNLRGKRADEIDSELDSYLNDACLSDFHQVRIIHGIGTGTVRQIVRDILASHPLSKSFRPGERKEGGDGVTIVNL